MKIETLVLGQMDNNCYLVWDEESLEAVIIDPADEGNFIIQKIMDHKLKPKFIIATHGHFDHVLAATELKLAFNISFLMHRADLPILKRVQETTKHFLGYKSDPPPKVDKYLKEGDEIAFGKETLKIIESPGHTPGSICLYFEVFDPEASDRRGILFSGDTLFAQGVGRTDFSYSSHSDLLKSIKEKLMKLPKDTLVYAGHGPETSIENESW